VDVLGDFLGIAFGIDQDRFIPSLEEMPASFVFFVEMDCIGRIQEVHHARQIAQRRFQDQVIMIWHQAIDMYNDPEFFMSFAKAFIKEKHVIVGQEDRLFLVPPGKNMIKGARVLDS
jgi:hypothetical protein